MTENFQSVFLNTIQNRYTSRQDLIEDISKVLHVGKDAVYRRLRGDTVLTTDELYVLSKHFNISLDELVYGGTDRILFTFNDFESSIKNIDAYLISLLEKLKFLRRLKNPFIHYASSEIPIFYYCLVPEVFFFKLFVWGRTLWDIEYLKTSKFALTLFNKSHKDLCSQILSEYAFLPSEELWSINLFDNTLYQIEYHAEGGYFDNYQESIDLCNKMYLLVEHFRRMASQSVKIKQIGGHPYETPFQLYHNEMIYTNNQILIKSETMDLMFSSFCNPNFIHSTEARMCDYTMEWFEKVRSKSTYLSGANEKSRNKFFDNIKRKIDKTIHNLEGYR